MTLKGKHILLGVSGGIAAYKIPLLIRLLCKAGAEVRCVTTRNALQFVTEHTLRTLSQNSVYTHVFAAINEHATEHISLPVWADLLLVAPATANVIGKFAAGIADDALTTTFASCATRRPVIIAPAMNDRMYANPATQQALQTLAASDNITVIEPADGDLACGSEGKGRMPEPQELQEAVIQALTPQTMVGTNVMITAGPTREPIDPVRYITNYSSGKMGYAIALECLRRGAAVTLVSGPVNQSLPDIYENRLTLINVASAGQMANAAVEAWKKSDVAILSAAVADFTPMTVSPVKMKKQQGQDTMTLTLTQTTDIAAALGRNKQPHQRLIGFALETDHEKENAQKKLLSKNLDWIVLNSLQDQGAGFGYDTNKVTLISAEGQTLTLPLMTKQEVAERIVEEVVML
ncbi:MAG: bifunctional phosphopantothenoylcysteine decarboxylase/phosphopantothenate--cysteine ligase CoaBC [Paludibacteraceae bacterium]|nr:bifunctional phosphopantothenoylcysteine decarboxylase/phosphopantothenate--cysteine ligase CoaBC [Paludibacteraceae bacterium]